MNFYIFCYLFSFKTIAASATIRVTTTSVAYVDFLQRAIIARAVVFAFRYVAADTSVHFASIFVVHHKKTSFFVQAVWAKAQKIIDNLKKK